MAAQGYDYLTALAPEVQHMIFDYLLPSHEPDKAFEASDVKLEKDETKPHSHSLDFLAATCKSLRDEVNEWALHFLAKEREITKYQPFKSKGRQERRDFLRGRNGLLTWIERYCVFCGNKSSRSAILMNGLRCCAKCDRAQWPDKITKTEAKMTYDLKEQHLLPSDTISPTVVKMLQRYPGLPKLRYGTYMTSNVTTTMFLRQDVEALAKLAHGDLRGHLAKRQADRDERRKKAKEAKAKRDAEAEAEKARQPREDHAELMWTYRHKHHSIRSYGSEAGPPTTPPMVPSSPGPNSSVSGAKKVRGHEKTLRIDSNAANEGRVVTPSPPQQHQPSRSISPPLEGVVRAQGYDTNWDDLPSMFGMGEDEWNALGIDCGGVSAVA